MRANRRAWILSLLLATAGLGLTGCGGSSPEPQLTGPRTRWQVGRPSYQVAPYEVKGVWYYPKVNYDYDETGTASWYGPGFDGKPTSDGEIYDMNQMTAAHKTLPLPSVVEVSNLQNGRAVRLRVNDRGPFVEDRLIDVSRRAAQLLGFVNTGVAPVRVRVHEGGEHPGRPGGDARRIRPGRARRHRRGRRFFRAHGASADTDGRRHAAPVAQADRNHRRTAAGTAANCAVTRCPPRRRRWPRRNRHLCRHRRLWPRRSAARCRR